MGFDVEYDGKVYQDGIYTWQSWGQEMSSACYLRNDGKVFYFHREVDSHTPQFTELLGAKVRFKK
ncbi:hypothetical protein SD71_10840 [Cohnella kolymensis]|uniref:Uncharacterized protein n=1 Tax=Cohnella kolymensis TaxID=1590652 RepID=A0ABR5A616_9BACL|nr:hypothetical protein [Cohnella kolymensis]KIL35877.1 hypothetical protein SD71_10840 [Cohnella kolymensis]